MNNIDNYHIVLGEDTVTSVPAYADDRFVREFVWCASSPASLGKPVVTDWSPYCSISVRLFSEKNTGHTVQMRFVNPEKREKDAMAPYFRYQFKADFEGEKTLTIAFDEMGGNYSPSLSAISDTVFDCTGWGLTPDPETKLTVLGIDLIQKKHTVVSPVPLDDPEVYAPVKDNWREYLVGYAGSYEDAGEVIKSRIEKYSELCKESAEKFDKTYTGEKGSAWGINVDDYPGRGTGFGNGISGGEVQVNVIYSNILNMAKGYAVRGCESYHDPAILDKIKLALEYGYKYYYGPNIWEKGTYGNWWHWDIGIPMTLIPTLMILEKELGSELIRRYLSPFDYLMPYPKLTACNKLWITTNILASAFLQCDAERILVSENMLLDIFDYVKTGDGFYEDGSFIQHSKIPYTGGYGLSMLSTLTELMMILGGTRFEMTAENVANQYRWIFENYAPVIYGANFMSAMRGREVARLTSEREAQKSAVVSMIRMMTYAPEDVKERLRPLIKHYMRASGKTIVRSFPMSLVGYAEALYDDPEVSPLSVGEYVKVFGNMDRVVRHGERYGICIALNSTRIAKYESINNENRNGWYQSEGTAYIYTGDYDYDYDFYGYVDRYKMPATTVSTRERVFENIGSFCGASPFVGGAEAGENGMAVFRLGYPENKFIKTDIAANKSCFLFGEGVVCVGSGIKDTFDAEVITVVENRKIREGDVFTLNGEKKAVSREKRTEYASYAHFTNMGGYVFLENTALTYGEGGNERNFLELTLSHGVKPTDGRYAYIYLPGATEKETAECAVSPFAVPLEISENVHVVRKSGKGDACDGRVTLYAFYEAGDSNGVCVSAPCCVILTEKDGVTAVSVSDPTHLLKELTVTVVTSHVKAVSVPENAHIEFESGRAVITLDIAGNHGQTYETVLGD